MKGKGYLYVLDRALPVELRFRRRADEREFLAGSGAPLQSIPDGYVLSTDLEKVLGPTPYSIFTDELVRCRKGLYATWKHTDCQDSSVVLRDKYILMQNAVCARVFQDLGPREGKVMDKPRYIQLQTLADISLRLVRHWRRTCGLDTNRYIQKVVSPVMDPQSWVEAWAYLLGVPAIGTSPNPPFPEGCTGDIVQLLRAYSEAQMPLQLPDLLERVNQACDLRENGTYVKTRPELPQPEPPAEDPPAEEPAEATPAECHVMPEGGVMDAQMGGRTHLPIKGYAIVEYTLTFDATREELAGCLALVGGKVDGCDVCVTEGGQVVVRVEGDVVDGFPAIESEIHGCMRGMHWKCDRVYNAIWRLLEISRELSLESQYGGAVH